MTAPTAGALLLHISSCCERIGANAATSDGTRQRQGVTMPQLRTIRGRWTVGTTVPALFMLLATVALPAGAANAARSPAQRAKVVSLYVEPGARHGAAA